MTVVPPSPELQALIMKELGEDPETKEASLQAIKEWLAKQPHLPDTWDELPLLNFLRGSNFSLEKCKKKLDLYFTMRTALPEFFANRDLNRPELQKALKDTFGAALPTLTPEGRRVLVMGFSRRDVADICANEVYKWMFMFQDVRLMEETSGITGDVHIFDTKNVTPSFASQLTPSLLKKVVTCVLQAYPMKMKEYHLINVHPLMELIFKIVKPLLKEKIVKRIYFHTDGYESLYKFVPKHILPEEYGGSAGKLLDIQTAWQKKAHEYSAWFKQQEQVKADETKRPAEMVNYDNIFGTEGSFKQLRVD